MKINDFVKKAIRQDDRNEFEKYNGQVDFIPDVMKPFFQNYNPADVEITMDGNVIRFFAVEELTELQKEYLLQGNRFIFASCNGDPIYLLPEGIVCTRCHGAKNATDEKMANDFFEFLGLIDN